MNKSSLLVLAVACAAFSAGAFAQTAPTTAPAATPAPGARHAMKVDTDGDGVVTREEAASFPRLASSFDQIDTNKDGKLGADEMQAWRAQMRGSMHGDRRGMDPERQARMQERRNACFDKADANHDGQLSRAEFAKMHEVCGSMRMGERHRPASRQGNPSPDSQQD